MRGDTVTSFFDTLETRSADERAAALAEALPGQIARAKASRRSARSHP